MNEPGSIVLGVFAALVLLGVLATMWILHKGRIFETFGGRLGRVGLPRSRDTLEKLTAEKDKLDRLVEDEKLAVELERALWNRVSEFELQRLLERLPKEHVPEILTLLVERGNTFDDLTPLLRRLEDLHDGAFSGS